MAHTATAMEFVLERESETDQSGSRESGSWFWVLILLLYPSLRIKRSAPSALSSKLGTSFRDDVVFRTQTRNEAGGRREREPDSGCKVGRGNGSTTGTERNQPRLWPFPVPVPAGVILMRRVKRMQLPAKCAFFPFPSNQR